MGGLFCAPPSGEGGAPLHRRDRRSLPSGRVGFLPSGRAPLTGPFLLSVPDGVLLGGLPPAAYFSRQRKVGKS